MTEQDRGDGHPAPNHAGQASTCRLLERVLPPVRAVRVGTDQRRGLSPQGWWPEDCRFKSGHADELLIWKCGRAVEGIRLESGRGGTHRGFESLHFRLAQPNPWRCGRAAYRARLESVYREQPRSEVRILSSPPGHPSSPDAGRWRRGRARSIALVSKASRGVHLPSGVRIPPPPPVARPEP